MKRSAPPSSEFLQEVVLRRQNDRRFGRRRLAVAEEGRLIDFIADHTATNPAEMAIQEELIGYLKIALKELNPREQYILRARFGLDDGQMRTLEEIGRALQLTRERVRQIEARALEKLRDPAYNPRLASFLDN